MVNGDGDHDFNILDLCVGFDASRSFPSCDSGSIQIRFLCESDPLGKFRLHIERESERS